MNVWSGIPGASRLVVVSNRVAPITEGQPTAGGLAAGVMDALRQRGGLWFGWSGELSDGDVPGSLREAAAGPVTLFTPDLSRIRRGPEPRPGVLILSQFAGAACELDAALIVNPFDPAETAEALERALAMPLAERRERHAAMLGVMRRNSLDRWRDRFVADLAAPAQTASATPSWPGSAPPSRPLSATRMPWTEAKPNV